MTQVPIKMTRFYKTLGANTLTAEEKERYHSVNL